MEYINKPAMTDDCCYANRDRPGVIFFGENGNPDTVVNRDKCLLEQAIQARFRASLRYWLM
jgi:hypothetical protein